MSSTGIMDALLEEQLSLRKIEGRTLMKTTAKTMMKIRKWMDSKMNLWMLKLVVKTVISKWMKEKRKLFAKSLKSLSSPQISKMYTTSMMTQVMSQKRKHKNKQRPQGNHENLKKFSK